MKEFEENFAEALKPVLEVSAFVSNVKEYEESAEKAKAESDMEKRKKAEEKSQKDEFKKLIKLARKNNEAHKFKDARKVLADIEKTKVENLEAQNKILNHKQFKLTYRHNGELV